MPSRTRAFKKYLFWFLALFACLGASAFLSPNYAGQAPAKASYFLHMDLGPGWQTNVNLANLENENVNLDVSAYDRDGRLLGGIPTINVLGPQSTNALHLFPLGSETIKLESKANILGISLFKSSDERKSESVPAAQQASRRLDFPPLLKDDQQHKMITIFNVDSASAQLEAIALDPSGAELQRASVPTVSSMASHTLAVRDLFSSQVLNQISSVRIVSSRSILGLQLVEPPETDLVGLPSLTTTSLEWTLPIATVGGAVELWTAVGLSNGNEISSAVRIEAFDALDNSLGIIDEGIISPRTTRWLTTGNILGSIPPETASLKVSGDKEVSVYGVFGVREGTGVTAIPGIPAEDATTAGFELVGSTDGRKLSVSPVVKLADGTIRSTSGGGGIDEWKERLFITREAESASGESTPQKDAPSAASIAPMISRITPFSGQPGDVVTIEGSGFASDPAQNDIRFGPNRGLGLSATGTQLIAQVPTGQPLGPTNVTVTVGGMTSNSVRFLTIIKSKIPLPLSPPRCECCNDEDEESNTSI